MNSHDLDQTIIETIDAKAMALEKILRSDVVCYFGQIHPYNFRNFRNFIEDVKRESKEKYRTISIILRTPGGSAETVERYVNIIRHHYEYVNFIIPDIAMSAGTIFCMSGDKIFMDYSSTLGPIDPQVMSSDGAGYIAALGYLDKVKELSSKPQLSPADIIFLRGIDIGKLALYEQARDLSVDLLKSWLVKYKFKDWAVHRTQNAGQPVTEDEKKMRAEEIAAALADNNKWHSHGRALGIDTLKNLRLEIDDYSNNEELRETIRGYNDILAAYADRMGLTFCLHSHLTGLR